MSERKEDACTTHICKVKTSSANKEALNFVTYFDNIFVSNQVSEKMDKYQNTSL